MKHPAIIRLIIVFFIFSFAADALAANYYCAKVTASVVDRGPTGTLVYGGTVMVQDRGTDQSYSTSSTGLNGNYKSIFVAGGDPVDITMKAKADNGYSFSGWFTSATATDAESTNATFTKGFATGTSTGEGNAKQHYMFAKFSPIPYDITYAKGDHGSGTSTTQSVNIESDITLLSGSLFTPNDGYEFKEWKVTSLGSTNKKWAMNQTYDSTNLHIGTGYYSNNVTLTAQWKEMPHADIIISVSGLENGESAIFNVIKGGVTLYTVALDSGNTSVTIKNQEIDSYTATPAGWSWSYTLTPLTETTQTIASPSTTFSFSATRDTNAKKHDEKSNVNWRP